MRNALSRRSVLSNGNGSVGWTKTRQRWKSGDDTPVETAILNVLNRFQMKDTLFLASGDCSAI